MKQFDTLGPFVVDDVIGRGGMGEVWGGRHEKLDVEVAIKVLSNERRLEGEEFRDALASEVQAMASLLHPGIVAILDYGHTSSANFDAVPYIVMERAGDTLTDVGKGVKNWSEAARPMVEILEALAHAHSRGLVHRDLKPHNVLRALRPDGFRWALTDFGLATPLSDLMVADERRRSGTPRYMSPEQVLGDVREQGPWTDLYGFGCLATWLLTGSAPFSGSDSVAIMRAHITEDLPTFRWRFPVPDDTADWLRLLLAKDPLDRYRHAADALHGLRKLGMATDATGGFSGWVDPISEVSDTDATLLDSVEPTRTAMSDDLLDVTPGRSQDAAFSPDLSFADDGWAKLRADQPENIPIQRPGFPTDWRGREHEPVSMDLVGASLGLWGIRQVPMVGREGLRDRLWTALRDVHLNSDPQLIVLTGGAGTGKSRLVEWFTQAAAECGGAQVMRAKHSDTPGPLDGVDGMIARHMRVAGAQAADVRTRVQSAMSEDGRGREFDAFDVATMMSIVAPEVTGSVSVSSTDERVAAMARYFAKLAHERPLILWLDDVQWGAEARALARYIMGRRSMGQVLVVATARDDLADAELSDWLDGIEQTPYGSRVGVEPLGSDDQTTLVTQMLRLSDDAAEQVVERTEGNPLFAVQLVGHWVAQGLLSPGDKGFEFVGDKLELPTSIRTLWQERLHRFVAAAANSDKIRQAVEIAAVLGEDIDFREWRMATDLAGVGEVSHAHLARALTGAGLASMDEGGWSFAHGLLRETVLAETTSDLEEAHGHCARALLRLYGDNVAFSGRIGRHWAQSRQPDRASRHLFEAAEYEARRADFAAAIRYDDLLHDVHDRAGLEVDDPARIRANLRRARTLLLRGEMEHAAAIIRQADAQTVRHSGQLRGEVLWTRSIEARHRADSEDGLGLAQQAEREFRGAGDEFGRARALQKQGEFSRRLGRFDESISHYSAAQTIYADHGSLFESGWVALGLCATLRQLGKDDDALEQAERALAMFERLGMGVGIGNVYNEMGEIKRYSGEHAAAAENYQRVIEAWSKAGHVESPVVYLNLALSWIGLGQLDRARLKLNELLEQSQGETGRGLRIYVLAALASIGAQTGEPNPAEIVSRFAELHQTVPIVDLDLAFQLTKVVEVTSDTGVREAARKLAIEQWTRLGRDDRAQQVRAM